MNIKLSTFDPYLKQFFGAVVGCVCALLLYMGYNLASPYLPEITFWPFAKEETQHASAPGYPKTGERWTEVTTLTQQMIEDSFEE